MVDLRYLGLTLIGVFLALAIGLMTGSALGSPDKRDLAYEGLREQMDLLREDVQRVREENDQSRRRLDAREQAARELLPLAVRDRLSGSRVGVVVCGPLDERAFWGELERALELAGAQIGPVLRIPDQLRSIPEDRRERLTQVWGGDSLSREGARFEAAAWIIRAAARGYPGVRLGELARDLGIEMPEGGAGTLRRLLVLTALPDEERAAALAAGEGPEFAVLEAARSEGLRVVLAEPEETSQSAIPVLASRAFATVDNIDTAYGQIAAVRALAGAEGRFGSKPGATRAVPALEGL
jgi:hypothetical protein